jgi:hypothetical protein
MWSPLPRRRGRGRLAPSSCATSLCQARGRRLRRRPSPHRLRRGLSHAHPQRPLLGRRLPLRHRPAQPRLRRARVRVRLVLRQKSRARLRVQRMTFLHRRSPWASVSLRPPLRPRLKRLRFPFRSRLHSQQRPRAVTPGCGWPWLRSLESRSPCCFGSGAGAGALPLLEDPSGRNSPNPSPLSALQRRGQHLPHPHLRPRASPSLRFPQGWSPLA